MQTQQAAADSSTGQRRQIVAAVWLFVGAALLALAAQTVLELRGLATAFVSAATWTRWTGAIDETASVPLGPCLAVAAALAAVVLAVNWRQPGRAWPYAVAQMLAGGWMVAFFAVAIVAGSQEELSGPLLEVTTLVGQAAAPISAVLIASWLVSVLGPWTRSVRRPAWWLVALCVVVGGVSLAMNVGLWSRLRVPHGDSAMYTEHLWNLTHDKGFRTYLDQGLFLGEHIQVIHLLLIPLHLLWPSHLLLEVAETAAIIACGPLVYRIARRHGATPATALLLAAAALLYTPLHYLDIAIDLKTFRPISFGVPLMLWSIDAIERRRLVEVVIAVLLTLACKEDFALVLAPLGVWWAVFPRAGQAIRAIDIEPTADTAVARSGRQPFAVWHALRSDAAATWRQRLPGIALAAFSVVYLLLAVAVIIPAFRGGAETHYALDYYPDLGKSAGEIIATCLRRPWIPLGKLLAASGLLYLTYTLGPLAGLPLLSPTRLAVAMPALAITIFNKFTAEIPQPVHHFHAPAVPVLLWAMAAAGPLPWAGLRDRLGRWGLHRGMAALACAIGFAVVGGLGPLSLKFWDGEHPLHWARLYVPDARAEAWPEVDALIPPDARVASTDFVRPQLMTRQRSYDYGRFRRAIVDYEDRVPDDTQWIVIDRFAPYGTVGPVETVREMRESPERWEVVRDDLFIVLRRRGE